MASLLLKQRKVYRMRSCQMLELKPLETFYSVCKDKQCYYICFSPQEFLEQAGNVPPASSSQPLPPHT